MKWKSILNFILKVIIFGLIVFIVVWIIGFLKGPKQNIIPGGAVSMDFPLKNGSYFIVYSGPSGSVHQTPGEKYSLDITKGTGGIKDLIASYITHDPKDNSTFDTPIYSPCFGNVKKVENNRSDLPIGTRDKINTGGNNVVVGCDGFDVYFAHIKQGSVVVKEGQFIKNGDLLGQIGNSGNTGGPHLHLTAFRTDANNNFIPLPMIFNGRYLNKSDIFNN